MNDTATFVRAHLPPCRLLEIGCGTGDVAAQLQAAGFQVIAIDENEEAVAEARAKAVNAIKASWPAWQPPEIDAILFTRSLHHIPDTRAAVAHAAKHAKTVLVEDFAFEECAPELIAWFTNEARASGIQTSWRAEHDHNLATARAMEDALREHFREVEVMDAPYLYRYLRDANPRTIERIAEGEMNFGTRPLGRRFVGRA